MHETIENIEFIEDMDVRHSILNSMGTVVSMSNSLGNLNRKSPFEARRVAHRASMGRSAVADIVRKRREEMTPFVRDACERHPNAGAAAIATILRRGLTFRRSFQSARRTIENDVKAIMKNLATVDSPA